MNKKKQITYTLVCLLILLIPNIACMILSTDLTYSWMKEMVYLAVVLLCYALPMPFLKQRTYFVLAGLAGLFWMPIEVSSLYLNKMTTSHHFIGIIQKTNWIEASEVMKTAWPLVIMTICLWVAYWILVSRIKNEPICPKWMKIPAGIVAVLLIGVCISVDKVGMKFEKIYPADIYLAMHKLHQEKVSIRQMQAQIAEFRFGLEMKQDSVEEHYIFILGEAARYDHFHINGYVRQTSPELEATQGVYSLQNMFAFGNNTYPTISKLITRATIGQPERAFKERSIVEAYQEAGYQTAWLSCQTWMDYVSRIAGEVDYKWEQVGGLSAQVAYDDTLVSLSEALFTQHTALKTFYVLHTMGSHIKYDQRYPKAFEIFTPAITAADGYQVLNAKNKEKIVNAYDNTILHTDHVIAQAIQILQQQNGICGLVYISDHGENLLDDERNLVAHSSYEGTIHEAHVPCFVWLNDAFRQTYPDKVAALETNIKKQVQSDVLFYSLADMGALDKIVDTKKSIFSPELQPADTIRMLTGNGNIVTIDN